MESLEMFKKRIVGLVIGIALTLTVTAGSGIVADWLGFSVTPQAFAQQCTGGGGGGC
jgi:hypothetical protein